jgi:hypothetical protein
MREHPDELTSDFCKWALRFRFADGRVQPLMHAADFDGD